MKKLFLFALALFATQFSQAQWEEDVRLTDTPDTSYLSLNNYHCIAASGDTVHIVWYDKSEGNWEIFYKRSTDCGLNWEPDKRLTYDEEFSGWPSISLSGPAVNIVWTDLRNGNAEVYFIRSSDGGTNWDDDIRLTEDPFYSYSPVITSSGSNIHLSWVNKDLEEGTWKVFYKNSSDGGINWGEDTWLSVNSPDAYCPSIAASGSDVYVVWNDNRDGNGNLEIYYRKSSDNGLTWGPETRLTNDPANSLLPSVSASGSSVDVAWMDSRTTTWDIYYKGSKDGGESWGNDIQVTNDPYTSGFPNIAYSNSVLHLVWGDTRSGYNDVYYNYSVDGGMTWAEETQLNDISISSMYPFIAVSGPVLHVIWRDLRDFNFEIYYKRNPIGGLVGMEDEPLRSSGGIISVSPNPASRQLTVGSSQFPVGSSQSAAEQSDVPIKSGSAVRLSIVDLYGREIKEFPDVSSFPCILDISDLTNGLYILRIIDEEGKSSSVKFLKIAE